MKSSFFEMVKEFYIGDLEGMDDIKAIQNAEAAKAGTEGSGDAYVEYSMEIKFKAGEYEHTVKMIAYTTSCSILVQNVGEPPEAKEHLGNRFTPKYFVDTFVLPWCERASVNKKYDEKQYVSAIENEIKRLDLMKLNSSRKSKAKGKDLAIETGNAKCANKSCGYKGLNSNNKTAVGICANCCNFEHFGCVKISADDREDIQNGRIKYFCSNCFSKNPSIAINFSTTTKPITPTPIPSLHSKVFFSPITVVPPVEKTFNITPTTTAVPIGITVLQPEETPNPDVAEISTDHNCTECSYSTKSKDALLEHISGTHSHQCLMCDAKEMNKELLLLHSKKYHSFACEHCDDKSISEADANLHKQRNHCHVCSICSDNFVVKGQLEQHLVDEHTIMCQLCKEKVDSNSELQKHIETFHTFKCSTCEEKFNSDEKLNTHKLEKHCLVCNECEEHFVESQHLEDHLILKHRVCCVVESCKAVFENQILLNHHVEENHSEFACDKCALKFTKKEDMSKHIEDEHSINCDTCNKKFTKNSDLQIHMKSHTEFQCALCPFKTENKIELEDHSKREHSYTCLFCKYVGIGWDTMVDHVLEKHAETEDDGFFSCDDCTFKTKDKNEYGKHFKDKHRSNDESKQITQDDIDPSNKEETEDFTKIKTELRVLKSSFSRLESMYHESLDEVNKVKSEYESKIILANDNYRVVKTENEVLKERVDVLFKLGRSYLNNSKAEGPGKANDVKVKQTEKDDDIEEIVNLENWTKNKLRGFKRVDPTTSASASKQPPQPKQTTNGQNKSKTRAEIHQETEPSTPVPAAAPERVDDPPNDSYEGKFCHFYVNKGYCQYEDRTGQKCRFEHTQAPMCNSGSNCTRFKCMFSHPKASGNSNQGNQNFLGPMMNSWPMMNPWMNQTPNPWSMPNPWNMKMSGSRNQQ